MDTALRSIRIICSQNWKLTLFLIRVIETGIHASTDRQADRRTNREIPTYTEPEGETERKIGRKIYACSNTKIKIET